MADEAVVLIVSGAGDVAESVRGALEGVGRIEVVASAAEARERAAGADVVVVAPPLPDGDALLLLAELAGGPRGAGPAVAVLPGGDPDAPRGLRVALRGPGSLRGAVADALSGEGVDAEEELDRVLGVVSRARHQINNPLTSALAETQLLLMDPLEERVAESLRLIEGELRRIRDEVAELRRLPRPRS